MAANPSPSFNSSPGVTRPLVMMCGRSPLSLRAVEDLLLERGINICHKAVRFGWNRIAPLFAPDFRHRRKGRSGRYRWTPIILRSHAQTRQSGRVMGRWLNNRAAYTHLPSRRIDLALLWFRRLSRRPREAGTLQKFASVHVVSATIRPRLPSGGILQPEECLFRLAGANRGRVAIGPTAPDQA